MALLATASTMCLPETGGENLPDTLEEAEDFAKGQSFFHILFIERKRKTATGRASRSLRRELSVVSLKQGIHFA